MNKAKKFLITLLLTVCTAGPASGSANAQSKYCYDSLEVIEIGRMIIENDMLKENEKVYEKKDSLFALKQELLTAKIQGLETIISLKDEQLLKLENIPHEIKQAGWQWWQYALACIGAVTFGFTAGVIYENMR